MILIKTKILPFFAAVILMVLFQSCERDRYQFPYVPINLNISLAQLDAEIGAGEHKFMYDNYGVNGLIIARNFDNEYAVYDRTCTYEQDYSCKVEDDMTGGFNVFLTCPCCGSQFFLDPNDTEGEAYVYNGPARYSLKKYASFINGAFLTVRN